MLGKHYQQLTAVQKWTHPENMQAPFIEYVQGDSEKLNVNNVFHLECTQQEVGLNWPFLLYNSRLFCGLVVRNMFYLQKSTFVILRWERDLVLFENTIVAEHVWKQLNMYTFAREIKSNLTYSGLYFEFIKHSMNNLHHTYIFLRNSLCILHLKCI